MKSETGGAQRRDSRAGWTVVGGGVVASIVSPSVILFMCFGTFAGPLRSEYGWSLGAVSIGATIISLVVAAAAPCQGWLIDRIGSRLPLLVSFPVFGACVSAMSLLPPDIRVFYLACACLPVAALGLWPPSFMRLVSTWFDQKLGLALGLVNVGPGIGTTLLPPLVGLAIIMAGWRQPSQFEPTVSDKEFVLVLSDYTSLILLPALMASVEKDAPNIRISTKGIDPPLVSKWLDDGECHLAFGHFLSLGDNLRASVLFHGDAVCIARRGHPAVKADLPLQSYLESDPSTLKRILSF